MRQIPANTLAALVVPAEGADRDQLVREVRERSASFRSFERVNRIHTIDEPFSAENGLMTATLKMKRSVIAERYGAEIDALYG